jgi:MerR family transcriptional regulator, light-induced transcriptional regulator
LFNFLFQSMNNVKNVFSIKDLENFSGVKAHTIRIWEKRYSVLTPMRTDTNIREYDLDSLQKLLNVTLLHNYGYKISKIAEYSEDKIISSVREIISEKSVKNHAISAFKMAMINFDQTLFFNTYNSLLSNKTFREVFFDVIIPLMNEIGLLWQANSISPAHEHFISYLIKQKLLINTEKLQVLPPTNESKVFVLYLPENEIHELGLMYLNYEILFNGYKTIYLGESVPISSLLDINKYFKKVVFVSYVTVEPNNEIINDYVKKIVKDVLKDNSEIWFIGRMVSFIKKENCTAQISILETINNFVEKIENL